MYLPKYISAYVCAKPAHRGIKLYPPPLFFAFSRGALVAYGGSQVRGVIGAVAASLRQSHSNVGSELHLQPTPQLTATPDP